VDAGAPLHRSGRAMTTRATPWTVRGAPWMRFAAPGVGGGRATGRGGGATGRGCAAMFFGGVRAGTSSSVADVSTRARAGDGGAKDDLALLADAESGDGAVPEAVKSALRSIGRVFSVEDAKTPGAPAIGMKTARPTVEPTPVPRWLAPFVDHYFVDHNAQAEALKAGRKWDAIAEEKQFARISKLARSGTDPELATLMEDRPKLKRALRKYRAVRRKIRKAQEPTYPREVSKLKFGVNRIKEKMGIHPRVDGEATYAQFLEYLDRREVSRVLLYDEGNTAIVEIGGPDSHLDASADFLRWKVNIPGDAHDEVTLACQKAFHVTEANPNDPYAIKQTPVHLYMNIKPWNMAIDGARNWLMAGTFFWFISQCVKAQHLYERSSDVLKAKAKLRKMQNERDALAAQFGRSKAKKMKKNKSTTRFSDVAGQDLVVDEFQTIINIMKGDPKYKGRAVEPPKGILLEGPPGTGKTLLAKAVAGEAGLPFFYANGSEFVEMFVGVAASRMRNLFKRARLNAPSIIFIDELDTIGRSRAANEFRDSSTSEREQGLMQMLVEMDGFDNKEAGEAVLVIGATNLASQLDPALLRSGRFDRVFNIGIPQTAAGRMPILQVHARNLNIDRSGDGKWEEDAFLHRVADLTTGFSGAEIANLLNEAAILSVRRNKETMDINDIEAILEKQAIGLVSAPLEDGWGKEHVAIMEAARAVIYSARPKIAPDVLQVSIRPRGSQISGVILNERSPEVELELHADDGPDTLKYYIESLAVMLAGRCAEYVFFGSDGISIRTNEELAGAAEMAFDIVTSSGLYPDKKVLPMMDPIMLHEFKIPRKGMEDGTRDVMTRAHKRGIELIKEYRPLIERVASELLENERVYGSQVRDMVQKYEATLENKSTTPSYADDIVDVLTITEA